MDYWLRNHDLDGLQSDDNSCTRAPHNTYQGVNRDETEQPFFLTCAPSLQNLVQTTEYHSHICDQTLVVEEKSKRGTVAILTLTCSSGHVYTVSSSPYLPNGKYLANQRYLLAYSTSGMIHSQIERFAETVGFSRYSDDSFDNHVVSATESEKISSCEEAIREEIGMSANGEIDIITDARHGWRKHAKDSNIVCIGQASHKVLNDVHVTKSDDPVSQRHEMVGTRKLRVF